DMQRLRDLTGGLFGATDSQDGRASPPKSPQPTNTWADLTRPGRVYKIIPPRHSSSSSSDEKESKHSVSAPLRFFTLGCADGGVKATARVAVLMEKLASGEEYDLILILGDNFDGAVKTRDSTTFLSHLHHIFAKHPKLKNIPKIAILGNHDLIDKKNRFSSEMLWSQVNHTYTKLVLNSKTNELEYAINPETGASLLDQEKIDLFMPKSSDAEVVSVPYEALTAFENQWYMFSSHFSVLWGDDTEIFCTNTSRLASESLARIRYNKKIEKTIDPMNQALWLEERMKKSAAQTKIFLGHHPVVETIDKRVVNSDHPDYVRTEEYEQFVELGMAEQKNGYPVSNHTDILRNILFHPGNEKLDIPKGIGEQITIFIAAHHHAEHLLHDGKRIQIVAGGMGGDKKDHPDLQNRFSFEKPDSIRTFMKNNGVVTLFIPAGKNPDIIADFFGLNDPKLQLTYQDTVHLRFSLKNNLILTKHIYDKNLHHLHDNILNACEEFQVYLSSHPPVPWQVPHLGGFMPYQGKVLDTVSEDITFVDALKNACNYYEPLSFEKMIELLKNVLKELTYLANSRYKVMNQAFLVNYDRWYAIFNEVLIKNYKISYEDFIQHNSLTALCFKLSSVTNSDSNKPKSLLTESLALGSPEGRGLFSSTKPVLIGTPKSNVEKRKVNSDPMFYLEETEGVSRSVPIDIPSQLEAKREFRSVVSSSCPLLLTSTAGSFSPNEGDNPENMKSPRFFHRSCRSSSLENFNLSQGQSVFTR
ncbi:MAG: metallophosphoesterase, partial [Gammaproteobacteria bacterium]